MILLDSFVEVKLANEDDFLKVRETLTRIGVASKKDQKLFFDAIINPPKPNKNLLKAAKNYNKLVASK